MNKSIIVKTEACRLDLFLGKELGISRSQAKLMVDDEKVLVNDKKRTAGFLVKENDVITIIEKEDKLPAAMALDIPICYENDDLLVINKPKGLVVHPAPGHSEDTLVNALIGKYQLSNNSFRPGIVHRLDKDTTGLMLVAKNDFAHQVLAEQIKNKTATRKYLALTHGVFKDDEAIIKGKIGRSSKDRKLMTISQEGKEAITKIKIIERLSNYTLVECCLTTGRTHQIRVHLTTIGYPLVGDKQYGRAEKKYEGQLLHSYYLSFTDPRSGKILEFTLPLPEEFTKALEELRKE